MNSMDKIEERGRPVWPILVAVLAVQFLSRYAAAPVVDFAQDDWHLCAVARPYSTLGEAWEATRSHPFRPLSALVQMVAFSRWASDPAVFSVLGWIGHSVFLLVAMGFVLDLTGSRRAAAIFGLVFAMLPNLTETFHWAELNAIAYCFTAYAASAWCWWRFWRTGRPAWLAAATAMYAVGAWSYEIGLFAPFCVLLLVEPRKWGKAAISLLPFAVVLGLYFIWRFTTVFGEHWNILYPNENFQAGFSVAAARWHLAELVRWWAGEHLWESLVNGLSGFWTLASRPVRLLMAANLAAAAAAGWWLWKTGDRPGAAGSWRVPLFGLAWAAATSALCLVSYTAGRLNHLPAFGVALAAAAVLDRRPARKWAVGLALLLFVALMANQGTARQWRDSTRFQRRLYERVCETRPEWSQKQLVLFDTRGLRQRLTRGLLRPVNEHDRAWYHYGNAVLFKGFSLRSMLILAAESEEVPASLLDAEHYARLEGGELVWSDKWNNEVWHRTPLADVYALDCFEAATGTGPAQLWNP